jgi:hypothetical protein
MEKDMQNLKTDPKISHDENKICRKMKSTFFVYFRSRYERISEKDINDVLIKYSKDSSATEVYDSHTGLPTGFIWVNYLYAKEGEEDYAVRKFMNKAHRIALEVGLSVEGPHCNVDWYHTNE